jgi:serine/threonine-protein kinase
MTRSDPQTVLADRYELGVMLGRGGMGTVYDGTDRRLGRSVAVKVLRADLAEQPRARRRFETEARAAARLAHPNVVTVFDSGEDDGIPFLVMERLPGRTLADELVGGALSVDRARDVGREMLAALAAAHGAGIIHRDIKPGNVLLTADGHVKVSDFGIAKTVDDADETQTAELVATVRYLAPERLTGAPATPRSDLYSVGVVLYEALSGTRAFDGESPAATMLAVERGGAPALPASVPREVAGVVERAMSRDADARYDSADAMAAALEGGAHADATVPVADTEPLALGTDVAPTRVLPAAEADTVPVATRVGPSSRRLGAALLAVLAIVLLAGIAWSQRGGSPSTPKRPPTHTTRTTLPPSLETALQQLEHAVQK